MQGEIRKIVTFVEELTTEGDRAVEPPRRRVAAAAVLRNPWHGDGYVEDLQPAVVAVAPLLAQELSARVLEALGGHEAVEAFGKSVLVGLEGEDEHGAALIHTPHFGDVYREAVGGTSIIAFADRRGGAGATLVVPMWHKTASATRSHYQTFELRIPDAPRPDELVIAVAAASGGRPHARIGDRTLDAAARPAPREVTT